MLATVLIAQADGKTYPDFAGLRAMDELWHWVLMLAVCVAVLVLIAVMYYLDSVELPAGITTTLVVLRLTAFLALLVFFVHIEKRTERKLVKNSRALLLIDTSQSMGLRDSDSTAVPAGPSRIEYVIDELERGSLIDDLRRQHDVVAYRFDEGSNPVEVASFYKFVERTDVAPVVAAGRRLAEAKWGLLKCVLCSGAILAVSLLCGVLFVVLRTNAPSRPHSYWALLASVLFLIGAFCFLGVGSLVHSEASASLLHFGRNSAAPEAGSQGGSQGNRSPGAADDEPTIDWYAELLPRGNETRLGEALRFLIDKERGGTLSAIVVFSDGGNNAGIEPRVAVATAADAEIPIHLVGMGAVQRPVNVRMVDIEAPARVYPGDDFTVQGLLRAHGMEGRNVRVQLFSFRSEGNAEPIETFIDERPRVRLASDGQEVVVKFEVSPIGEGRRTYVLRVVAPDRDHDLRDNEKSANVEVVDRKNRVLLLAGGPTREFRFLRNQLHRDKDTILDVLLQSGVPGMAQEADNLLFEFPTATAEMFQYDCVVAFDPDWQSLSDLQVELLDRWVAEKAGGLIVVAGPVHTPQWSNQRRGNRRIDTIKGLYPVAFYNQGSATLRVGRFGGEEPWQLNFTRDGREAEFLWLGERAAESEQTWSEFDGVFGYYAVKDPKPGARIYANFSDPDTSIDDELPVYLAGHFYGAGRVFFQASGEMWRLRAVDEKHFEQYYTKLIRWVSQGRLLRDSNRGVLLVDKDRCLLGDHIAVRAILTDAQHHPLADEEVTAILLRPDSTRTPLTLRRVDNSVREGMYAGQFTALQEGDYRIELKVSDSDDEELFEREVRVRLPDLEVERPQRRDALMIQIAKGSGGRYFVGIDAAMNRNGVGTVPVAKLVESRQQVSFLPGTPDGFFQKLLMSWLLAMVCGALCLEWTIRRLSKLA